MTIETVDRGAAEVSGATFAGARAALAEAVSMLRAASEHPVGIDELRAGLLEVGGLLPHLADCMYGFVKDLPLADSDGAMPIHPYSTHREIHTEAVSNTAAAYSAAERAAQELASAAAGLGFAAGTFSDGSRIWPEQLNGSAAAAR